MVQVAQVPDTYGAGSKTLPKPAPHFGLPRTSNGAGSGHKIGPAPFNTKPAPVIPYLPPSTGEHSTWQSAKTAKNAHSEMLQHAAMRKNSPKCAFRDAPVRGQDQNRKKTGLVECYSTWPRPKSWETGPGHVLKKTKSIGYTTK